ncbi:MAG: DUF4012 domain-containing protein [Chloroflexota bacterium]
MKVEIVSNPVIEELKQILHHVRSPEALDDHPWTRSLIVREVYGKTPHLIQVNPGQQLIGALASLFQQLQPANPPRAGKRLDPRWGEFGLLAALYFAPFNYGTPFPSSLLDAWRRIDSAILYLVYGKPVEELSEEQIKTYQLVGSDLEYGSTSTLSDWHKKGLQRFAELILNRERLLSRSSDTSSPILDSKTKGDLDKLEKLDGSITAGQTRLPRLRRAFWLSFILVLIFVISLGVIKGWKVYDKGRVVYQDVTRIRERVRSTVEITDLETVTPDLLTLQTDLHDFTQEVQPLLWISPKLGWLPDYGGDLASAPAFVELAEHVLNTAIISLRAAQPLLTEINSQDSTLDPAGLTALLVDAQPPLLEARAELDQALATRKNIQAERLDPRLQGLLVDELDPLLNMANDGLSLATALPIVLGATQEGPKTYLVLALNEDELRPTGGFITSVGNLVLRSGRIISLEFEGMDFQEDWSKPYPAAPWQLQEYMNSSVLILRDTSWFTDFPTSVLWAENLYAYNHSHSVDGVIAFDQHFLVMVLGVIGPLDVEGVSYPITSANVIEYMRAAKNPPVGEPIPAGWDRKEFIGKIAHVVLMDLMGGKNTDWRGLAGVLKQALAERHLLVQFDDPEITSLLAKYDWDNAVRPVAGDFLMTTDTNIGFNKTNALVNISLSYAVDLTDISAPQATLTVSHKNNASRNVPCIHWNSGQISGEERYPMNRCYWNYLRVYKEAGASLLDASPHAIPGEWMLLGQAVPARVDDLEEEIAGVRGFGTLLVVPGGQALETGFRFALPASVLVRKEGTNRYSYHLKVQKQPGTQANPLVIRIHLPNRSTLESISMTAIAQDTNLLIETDLRTDVEFDLVFSLP